MSTGYIMISCAVVTHAVWKEKILVKLHFAKIDWQIERHDIKHVHVTQKVCV